MPANSKKKGSFNDCTLPVSSEVRQLADEAMRLGDYGTLTNTIKVALREQIKRLQERAASEPVTA